MILTIVACGKLRRRLAREPSPDRHLDAMARIERDRFADGETSPVENGFRGDAAVASGENRASPGEPHAVRARQVKRVVADVQEKIERALAAANRDFAAGRKDLPYDIPAGLGGIPPPGVGSLL